MKVFLWNNGSSQKYPMHKYRGVVGVPVLLCKNSRDLHTDTSYLIVWAISNHISQLVEENVVCMPWIAVFIHETSTSIRCTIFQNKSQLTIEVLEFLFSHPTCHQKKRQQNAITIWVVKIRGCTPLELKSLFSNCKHLEAYITFT